MKKYYSLLLIGFCCSFLTGCPLNISKPKLTPDAPLPPIEESCVNVTTTLPLSPLVSELDQQIPSKDDGANAWDVVGTLLGYDAGEEHLVWRDPLNVSMNGDQLTIGTTAHYWVKVALHIENGAFGIGGYSWDQVAQCGTDGDAQHDAILRIDSTVWLTNDYTLHSLSHSEQVNCPQACLLTAANKDFTYIAKNLFQSKLDNAAGQIDSKLPGMFSAKGYASTAWSAMQAPIALDNDIWLNINPDKLTASPFNGNGQQVNVTIGLLAHPEIIAGSKPAVGSVSLPDLGTGFPGNNFHVALDTEVSFDWASEQIAKQIVGREYPLDGHKIKIENASVYGTGTITVLQVGISGDASGTIYFTGTPFFNPTTDIFSIQNLDYSLETQNIPLKVADWLLHSGLKESLADQAKWDLTSKINDAKSKLNSALNRKINDAISVSGSDISFNLLGICSTPDSWKVRLVTDGTVNVNVSN